MITFEAEAIVGDPKRAVAGTYDALVSTPDGLIPIGRLVNIATVATRTLSWTAVHSSGERLSHPSMAIGQSLRCRPRSFTIARC